MVNEVELIGWYGGDKAIARAAWTSTQIEVDSKTDEEIGVLINEKLWNNSSGNPHKSPFERGIVEFNIVCEQASHIHAIKHRLANINGESARYKELKHDKYYIPKDWKGITCDLPITMTQGYLIGDDTSTNFKNGKGWTDWSKVLEEYTKLGNALYHQSLKELTPILGRKRAKESARYFKTMNSQITLSVMMNMSCFYNFISLRRDDAAQLEIREIASDMVDAVKNIEGNPFKHTIQAFGI